MPFVRSGISPTFPPGMFAKIITYHKKITMSKNIDVFQILLYIEETSIYNFVLKFLETFYTYIVKTNCQFSQQKFLSQSILFGTNVILNCFIPMKYLHIIVILYISIILYKNLGTFCVHLFKSF